MSAAKGNAPTIKITKVRYKYLDLKAARTDIPVGLFVTSGPESLGSLSAIN